MPLTWQEVCRWCAEFWLLTVQLAVINLIVRQRRRRVPRYCGGFFLAFLCKTSLDTIWFIEGVGSQQLYVVGVLSGNFFDTPVFPFVNCTFIYCQQMCLSIAILYISKFYIKSANSL
ncbi:hypothetical protein AAVH_16053 [Aphelenchoides avenae]|nr:hypothetical protein AAVH_16053 [Aphelenchus avenae]